MPDTDLPRNTFGKAYSAFCQQYSGWASDGTPCRSESALLRGIVDGYVELIGPTRPVLLTPLSDTAPDAGQPVHEYSWSLGITGREADWYRQLDQADPIIVQLIFHTAEAGYAVQEVAANLKLVSPYRSAPKTTGQQILGALDVARPLVDTAGKLMELGGLGIPGKMVSALSQMKLNAVPTDQFPWFVKTFSWGREPGVEWHIPKYLIDCSGNRLIGSLGVSLLDCGDCGGPDEADPGETFPGTAGLPPRCRWERTLY